MLLREGRDSSWCQEGPSWGSERWRDEHGTGTHCSPSSQSELPPYQQPKIPEGSKAVNVREAKSGKKIC